MQHNYLARIEQVKQVRERYQTARAGADTSEERALWEDCANICDAKLAKLRNKRYNESRRKKGSN